MKSRRQIFSASGATDGSPRRQPWDAMEEMPSPGRGDRKQAAEFFFRPVRGLARLFSGTHGFTVGYSRLLLRSFLCVAFIALTGNLFAADVTADFNAANKLYAEGKFAAAAAGYEKILQSGAVSPALWFNYGNAEYKLGQPGRAIAAYRRAELLAPRDDEVRANLDFVRKQVEGPTLRESWWENWLGALTLNEWAGLAACAFWLTFILFAARQIRPAGRSRLRGLTTGIVIITILSCVGLSAATAIHFTKQTAVVVEPEVMARSGPFTEAQDAFKAHNGAELAVLNRREHWLQVSDGAGNIGWLPAKQVEILPGA